jgi:hypothetical protein
MGVLLIGKEFEHPLDGPKGEIQDVFHKKKPLAGYVLHPIIFDI